MDLIPLDYDPFAPQKPAGVLPEPGEPVADTRPAPTPVTPVAPETQPTPPETVIPPVAEIPKVELPKVKYAADKPKAASLIPLDYDPFAPVAPKKEPDSWADPKDYALLRGGAEGLESIKGGKDFLTVMDLSFGGKDEDAKKKIILEQAPETAPTGWERRVPSVSDIGGVGDFSTWLQESAGSGVTSTMPSLIGGMAGGIGGTALGGPVGGMIGAAGGAAIPSVALGVSGMYQDMRGNEGVRKALQDGTINADQFQKIVWIGGLMTGALDSIPAAHWGGKAIGLEMAKKEVRDTLIKAAIKGGLEEGGTEGLQQIVSEVGQTQGGGTTSLGQSALNVLDASLQGLVGGMVFGAAVREKVPGELQPGATEEPPKIDDQPEVAAPTQPEGTPVSTEAVPDSSTPGGIAATPQAPPATTEPVRETQRGPVVEGGVETVTPGAVPSDVGAALGGAPVEQPVRPAEQPGAIPDAPPEFNLREEMPETASDQEVSEAERQQQERLRAMFAGQDLEETTAGDVASKQQEKKADQTTVAPAGADVAAALEANKPAPQVAPMAETLGTGRSQISQEPAAEPAAKVAVADETQTPQVVSPAAAAVEPIEAPVQRSPGPPEPLQPQRPLLAAEPAVEATAAPMAPVETPVAAFTVEPAAEPVTQLQQPVTKTEEPAITSEVTAPLLPPAAARAVEVSVKREKATAPRTEVSLAAEPTTQAEPKTAPAKAEAAKAVSKSREGPAERVTKAELEQEAAAKKQRLEEEAAARKAREAERSPLARDIHREAQGQIGGMTTGDLQRLVGEESDKAAREVDKSLSPLERIKAGARLVVERVKARHEAEGKAELDAYKSEEDIAAEKAAKETYDKEQKAEAQKKLREEQAKAESGQQKERAGSKKGLSSAGRRVQSDKSLKGEYERELKTKKPEDRNPLLAEYASAKTDEDKAAVREKLVRQAEQEEERAASEELSKEHAAVRDKVQTVMDKLPTPAIHDRLPPAQEAKMVADHLRAFKRAITGIRLPDKISRAYQSVQESLAIFAKKTNDPLQFMKARILADDAIKGNKSAEPEFYATVMGEHVQGAGYSESKGADERVEGDQDVLGRDETRLGENVHRQSLDAENTSAWGEAEALIRSGRKETQEGVAARRKREEAAEKPERPVKVTRPDGKEVAITASTRKGSAVLRDLNNALQEQESHGFIGVIQNALIRHLSQMVGDIDVHFVNREDMAKLHDQRGEAGGLYYNYSAKQRADGMKPAIFIASDLQTEHELGGSLDYNHTVLHEFTHAATSLALQLDLRGTRTIVSTMMGHLYKNMSISERARFDYAFKNEAEFVAEAFSNQGFQQFLAESKIPAGIAQKISGVAANRLPSWMNAVTAMVSNALGLRWGTRGQSYMEHLLKLYPTMATSAPGQERMAREEVARLKSGVAMPRGPAAMEPQALIRQFDAISEAARSSYANVRTPGKRRLRDWLATGGELIRRSEHLFGGVDNPLRRLIEAHLKRDTIRADMRKSPGQGIDNEALEMAQLQLQKNDKTAYNNLSRILHEMSRYRLDATVGLADRPNSHIDKSGTKDRQVRAKHAELAKAWNALPQAAKDVGLATIQHYRNTSSLETESIIRHAVETSMNKYGTALPQGKTVDDAVAWVMSRDAMRDVGSQTQTDKDWHAALGKTAQTVAGIPDTRAVKGVYVPFMRRGKYYISASERPFGTMQNPTNLPKGAVMDAENRLLFANEADFKAFADSHPEQVRATTMYVDPTTGKKVTSHPFAHPTKPGVLIVPRKVFVATIQNKRVEMSDNYSQLVARARELQAQGHHVSDVAISEQSLHQAIREMAPPEITRLLRNLEQTTIGQTTVGQQAVANSVYDAYLRQMTSPGALARGLKRRGVLGEDLDLVRSTRDYNRDLANTLANTKVAAELSAADTEVKKYINDNKHLDPPGSGNTIKRQAMYDEVARRVTGFVGDNNKTSGQKINNIIKDIVTLRHLFSPHYTVQNMMQPGQTTLPILGSRHGYTNTVREMEAAYRVGGRARVLAGGVKRSVGAIRDIVKGQTAFDNDSWWRQQMLAEPDGAELADVADRIRELGWGATSGIEAPSISELDMGAIQKGVHRISNIAKALPEAVEGVNRYSTAIAAYRLARKDGMSHEQAVNYAALTVEETQGGYAPANNPLMFQDPKLSWALQFRKYGLSYGQAFYRNLRWMVSRNPAKRKAAGKALAGMALTTVALAGVTGLPLVEPLRLLVNGASMLLGTDDWDETERGMQNWLSKMVEWASGSKDLGSALSEATMQGFTRLANIDTHGMFSNDSLFLFGEPKSLDNEGIQAWLMRAVGGAPGGMLFDTLKHASNGDYLGAVPWPKLMQNVIDGYKMYNKGTVDPSSGKQYHKPYSAYESVAKGLGFRPAEESRPFEAGGSAAASKDLKQMSAARRGLMEKWRNKSPGERANFFTTTIRDWNASHRNPDEKIQMQDLLRSVKSSKAYDKRLQKMEYYAD